MVHVRTIVEHEQMNVQVNSWVALLFTSAGFFREFDYFQFFLFTFLQRKTFFESGELKKKSQKRSKKD